MAGDNSSFAAYGAIVCTLINIVSFIIACGTMLGFGKELVDRWADISEMLKSGEESIPNEYDFKKLTYLSIASTFFGSTYLISQCCFNCCVSAYLFQNRQDS